MKNTRYEQDKINSEVDRRLLEFQSPKEIIMSVNTSTANVFRRAEMLGLYQERITRAERDLLLVKRKDGGK